MSFLKSSVWRSCRCIKVSSGNKRSPADIESGLPPPSPHNRNQRENDLHFLLLLLLCLCPNASDRHTRCLAEYFLPGHELLKPVLFFIGDYEFKTLISSNVLNRGIVPYIKDFRQECMSPDEVYFGGSRKSGRLLEKFEAELQHYCRLIQLQQFVAVAI
jgi:hypothetical protein